ncbi:hypothetical protein ACFCX4_09235 [Kitasatospora sp. NPDC056327]|uniref:hypothetical protein n=1 Tax=Kitasatospora sp. NPDC056327 TaxID=3345785 RepID=UPI0035E10771
MGQKIIRFSDLTGEHAQREEDLVRVVVRDHPDLVDGPVEIEALPAELAGVTGLALDLVTVELHHPDGEEPETVVMTAEAFDRLAIAVPMAEVLRGAKRVPRGVPAQSAGAAAVTAAAAGRDRPNYASLEHAGRPHKGRTTDAEKQLVREHLAEVNERLAAEGVRTVDLGNPEHVARYGLEELARERGAAQA